jgi:hypothetical protein
MERCVGASDSKMYSAKAPPNGTTIALGNMRLLLEGDVSLCLSPAFKHFLQLKLHPEQHQDWTDRPRYPSKCINEERYQW